MSDGGKGSAQRPTDKQKFDEAFERIFGKKPKFEKAIVVHSRLGYCQRQGNETCSEPFCSCEEKHEIQST